MLLQAVIEVVAWRRNADNPKEGEALIELVPLPNLLMAPDHVNHPGGCSLSCHTWLPIGNRWRTKGMVRYSHVPPWTYRDLGMDRNKRRDRREARLVRGHPNPIAKARLYEAAHAGGTLTYEEVAARFGVTRATVCQYLTLLKRLPAPLIAAVEAERDPLRLRTLSLKRLVGIARLPTGPARRQAATSFGL